MLFPAEAAVPARLENNSIAAEMAAGRTRVTARALISIGISKVAVVMASRLMISVNSAPATSSSPRPMCNSFECAEDGHRRAMRAGGLGGQDAERMDQHAQCHQCKAVETALPVEGGLQPGADQRRQCDKRAAQGHVIEAHSGTVLFFEQVLHQRVAQYEETAAHSLYASKQQEGRIVVRQCAAHRSQDRQHDTAEQDFLASPFIRERPGDHLRDRKHQRKQTDRQRDVCTGGVEPGCQRREGGQQDIDREEADQGNAGDEDEAGEDGPRHCYCFPA